MISTSTSARGTELIAKLASRVNTVTAMKALTM